MSHILFQGFNPAQVLAQVQQNQLAYPAPLNSKLQRKIFPLTVGVINAQDHARGIRHVIRRTGNIQLQLLINNSNYIKGVLEYDTDLCCWWCLTRSYNWPVNTDPWGLPLRYYFDIKQEIAVYDCVGYYCSAECMYAFALLRSAGGDPFWSNCVRLAQNMYHQIYPDRLRIKAAPDFLVRDLLGGPCNEPQMQRLIHMGSQWIPQDNIIVNPVARAYMQTNMPV